MQTQTCGRTRVYNEEVLLLVLPDIAYAGQQETGDRVLVASAHRHKADERAYLVPDDCKQVPVLLVRHVALAGRYERYVVVRNKAPSTKNGRCVSPADYVRV